MWVSHVLGPRGQYGNELTNSLDMRNYLAGRGGSLRTSTRVLWVPRRPRQPTRRLALLEGTGYVQVDPVSHGSCLACPASSVSTAADEAASSHRRYRVRAGRPGESW